MKTEMRQVDRDELAWKTFLATRHWSATRIREMFGRNANNRSHAIWIGADVIAAQLHDVRFHAGGAADALNRDAVRSVIAGAIETFPGAIGDLWRSRISERMREARSAAANLIVDALDPYVALVEGALEGMRPSGGRPQILWFPDLSVPPHAMAAAWP